MRNQACEQTDANFFPPAACQREAQRHDKGGAGRDRSKTTPYLSRSPMAKEVNGHHNELNDQYSDNHLGNSTAADQLFHGLQPNGRLSWTMR